MVGIKPALGTRLVPLRGTVPSAVEFSNRFASDRMERDLDIAERTGSAAGFGSKRELCSFPMKEKKTTNSSE
jgi:hypothetical protein